MEPISPELVLVDPVLAEAERGRLRLRDIEAAEATVDRVRTRTPPLARPPLVEVPELPELVTSPAAGDSRRRFRNVLLTVSLMLNVILIAVVVPASREHARTSAFPPALRATTQLRPQLPHPKVTTGKPRAHPKLTTGKLRARPKTAAAVERAVLTAVVQSPAGKLPRQLIDRSTGLAKNNLQAVCHASGTTSFECVVRPARHRPAEGLYLRYMPGPNGRAKLAWNPYRAG